MPGAHTKRDAAARNAPRQNQGGLAAGSFGAQPEPYDGPGSNSGEARGRAGSAAGNRSSSRPGSQVRGSSQTRPAVDPARDPATQVLLRNVDFGGAAYNIFSQVSPKFAYLPTVSMSLCAFNSRFPASLCVEFVKLLSLLPNDLRESEYWLASCYSTKESCCVTPPRHTFRVNTVLIHTIPIHYFSQFTYQGASHRGILPYLNPLCTNPPSFLHYPPTPTSPTSNITDTIIHSASQQALHNTSATAYQHLVSLWYSSVCWHLHIQLYSPVSLQVYLHSSCLPLSPLINLQILLTLALACQQSQQTILSLTLSLTPFVIRCQRL